MVNLIRSVRKRAFKYFSSCVQKQSETNEIALLWTVCFLSIFLPPLSYREQKSFLFYFFQNWLKMKKGALCPVILNLLSISFIELSSLRDHENKWIGLKLASVDSIDNCHITLKELKLIKKQTEIIYVLTLRLHKINRFPSKFPFKEIHITVK